MSDQPHDYELLASVDLGSNSFRLQIVRVVDGQLFAFDSIKEVVRFAAGLTEDKYLTADVQEKAWDCLARFGERLRGFAPALVRVVGTNTLRVAKNLDEFLPKAEALLGFPIEIIAGREEARLIYVGVAHQLPATSERRLVIDIGGGSSEFVIGQQYDALVTESLPLGCVSYTLRYFKKGLMNKENFEQAILAARDEIQRIAQRFLPSQWQCAIGTSGTARALRDIFMYQDGSPEITMQRLVSLKKELISQRKIKNLHLPGLKEDRTPVMAGGLAIMIAIFEEMRLERLQVNDAALRDGVLYDLLGRWYDQDVRDMTVAQFKRRYHVDAAQAERVQHLAERFYRMLMLQEEEEAILLKSLAWAAQLHEIGLSITHTGYHKHSAYIVQNADMPGFSKGEQAQLAQIILGHRGDVNKIKYTIRVPGLGQAIVALRLAVLFYRRRVSIPLPAILDLQQHGKRFALVIEEQWLKDNPLTYSAFQKEIRQWQSLGFDLTIIPTAVLFLMQDKSLELKACKE